MTGTEVILHLKMQLNQLDTGSNKTLYTEVALQYLDKAYKALVRAKYGVDRFGGDYFGENQEVDDDLNHLIKTFELDKSATLGKASVAVTSIPSYFFYLDTEDLKVNNLDTVELRIKPVGVKASKIDPFTRPEVLYPTITFAQNSLQYDAGSSAEDFKGTIYYLAEPDKFSTDGEYAIPFINEIINIAATMILENWESGRIQSKPQVDQAIKNN